MMQALQELKSFLEAVDESRRLDTKKLIEVLRIIKTDLERHSWRPIAEIREDYSLCAVINFREDCADVEITSCNSMDFDESKWTHFAQLPILTTAQVEEWLENNQKIEGATE